MKRARIEQDVYEVQEYIHLKGRSLIKAWTCKCEMIYGYTQ